MSNAVLTYVPENVTPLAVQVEALRRSAGHAGFAYFMEQGLGKTLTTLLDFLRAVEEREATRLMVVCPNSFKGGWVDDAKDRGLGDKFDFYIWESGNESTFRWWCRQTFKKPPVLIVNYEAIRATYTEITGPRGGKKKLWETGATAKMLLEFVEGKNAMIAFDESIKISTYDASQTIGALRIAPEFRLSRILSGKPIKQGPHDLWSQMRAIFQMRERDYYSFKGAFCKMGGYKMKQVMAAQNEDLLAPLIEPHVFRATKKDWTDLPPKLYTIRDYKMTPEMQKMYNAMHHDFVLWLNETENVSVDAAITKYIKLAQIQCGWIYKEDGTIHQLVPDAQNPRLQLLLDTIEDEVVGKVAIPYHHKPVFDQLLRSLGGEQQCAWIKGGMSPAELTEQKRRFNKDPEARFILLQDDAAKYGHTLLGIQDDAELRCATMIFYENNYSLDTRSQIEDRPHRHGQTAESVLYLDLSGTPLDRDCCRALQRKEGVFQAVFANIH